MTPISCQVCGKGPLTSSERCTNQCCLSCHDRYCNDGGSISPGHTINLIAARRDYASRKKEKKHG